MKLVLITALAAVAVAFALAETKAGLTESATVGGKNITIKYSSPAVNGREGKLYGKDGTIGTDKTYPVWRAGANDATVLHTDADIELGGLKLAKGDYSLYINLADLKTWELIVNKQTGQEGTTYDPKQDVGRIKMTMSKPKAMVEQLKYTITGSGNRGKLTLGWEDVDASVNFTVK
jgi:hypothetical protein